MYGKFSSISLMVIVVDSWLLGNEIWVSCHFAARDAHTHALTHVTCDPRNRDRSIVLHACPMHTPHTRLTWFCGGDSPRRTGHRCVPRHELAHAICAKKFCPLLSSRYFVISFICGASYVTTYKIRVGGEATHSTYNIWVSILPLMKKQVFSPYLLTIN
jgi:hypothetical protein